MAGELSIQLAVCLFRQLLVMFCKACNVASVPFACLEPKVRVLADLSSSFATSQPSYVGFNFSSWMQAIRLIPEAVMLRAQQRADEEPLRLNENWVTACCIFLMWNMSAVGTLYLVCTKFGKPWWRRHWWVAAIILVAIMVLAEIVWAACTILLERRTKNQSDKQTATDLGVNAPLLVTQDGDDQLTMRVDM